MSDTVKVLVLLMLALLRSTTSYAEEFSLKDLRLFFTPEERNTRQVVALEVKAPITHQVKSEVVHVSPRIRYIGEIRSQTKKRFFWKRGLGEYLTTVPKVTITEQSHGKAKHKAASNSTKAKHAG